MEADGAELVDQAEPGVRRSGRVTEVLLGGRFEGRCWDGWREGRGTLYFSDGEAHGWAALHGTWKRGRLVGPVVLTLEDGLIGTPSSGPRGFAALAAGHLGGTGIALQHFGIVDPTVAPSESFLELWEHFGMTEAQLLRALVGNK